MNETIAQLRGIGVGRGVALGPALRMPEPLAEPAETRSELTPEAETERAETALAATAAELTARAGVLSGTAAEVLEAQALMAADPTLKGDIVARIGTGKTAESASVEAFRSFQDMLRGLGGYMAERAADLGDISQRVLASLLGVPAPGIPVSDVPFVLVARDLAPADTATLDLDKVLAVVTAEGGPTSHTAILAREKSIIAVVGAEGALDVENGTLLAVDAVAGTVELSPDAARQDAVRARIAELASRTTVDSGPGALSDGTLIPLLANLGATDGIPGAVAAGAEGVGLFRTEFLFLGAANAPTVLEQQEDYRALLAGFPGQKVVVRLLDAGADKPLAFLNSGHEENPALGVRGLRALRANEDILREQLTALANADAETEADLWVMAPMVSTVEETTYFVSLAKEMGLAKVGVMVEVPSSALLADQILAVADFASIGTNDLTQYTMAADRMLGAVASLQDPWHPAVLRLVREVGRAGAKHDKPVGICGEAAADPLLALVLVGLGATTLSMSPSALADVRTELAGVDLATAGHLADLALAADSAAGARAAVVAALTTREGEK
jgi:phosphoenolpyruvate-protein phosphotransferase (PTS system enzyme I)